MIPMNRDLRRKLAAGAMGAGLIAAPALILSPQIAALMERAGIERPPLITDPSLAMLMMARSGMLLGAGSGVSWPIVNNYTESTGLTDTVPAGAATVVIECVGAGGQPIINRGGGGGAYSKATISTSGISVIWTAAGTDAIARVANSVGTLLCLAAAGVDETGGDAASGTGDIKNSGGNGATGGGNFTQAGGGAGGPSGNGSAASGGTPGVSGGAPGSNGAAPGQFADNYGGGGGAGGGSGAALVRLTYTP